ncbi:Hypothetical_protein [Hexamita inflata]|uniref:Hypothetical_protein n=1 Tax=Hexamita inflata TaxID=28002 RepID=A0AA86N6N6_9EUKA|nr:Hypothetical protein HINF_LOCUS1468 [Hexamita inflata]
MSDTYFNTVLDNLEQILESQYQLEEQQYVLQQTSNMLSNQKQQIQLLINQYETASLRVSYQVENAINHQNQQYELDSILKESVLSLSSQSLIQTAEQISDIPFEVIQEFTSVLTSPIQLPAYFSLYQELKQKVVDLALPLFKFTNKQMPNWSYTSYQQILDQMWFASQELILQLSDKFVLAQFLFKFSEQFKLKYVYFRQNLYNQLKVFNSQVSLKFIELNPFRLKENYLVSENIFSPALDSKPSLYKCEIYNQNQQIFYKRILFQNEVELDEHFNVLFLVNVKQFKNELYPPVEVLFLNMMRFHKIFYQNEKSIQYDVGIAINELLHQINSDFITNLEQIADNMTIPQVMNCLESKYIENDIIGDRVQQILINRLKMLIQCQITNILVSGQKPIKQFLTPNEIDIRKKGLKHLFQDRRKIVEQYCKQAEILDDLMQEQFQLIFQALK